MRLMSALCFFGLYFFLPPAQATDFSDLSFNPDRFLNKKVSLRGKINTGPYHDTKSEGKFYLMELGENRRYQDGTATKTRFEADGNYILVYVPVKQVDTFVAKYKRNPGTFSGLYRKLERNEYDRYDGVMQRFVYYVDTGDVLN